MIKGYCKDCDQLVADGSFLEAITGKIPEGSLHCFVFKDGLRCPEDADEVYIKDGEFDFQVAPRCQEVESVNGSFYNEVATFECTRRKGHKGKHHCHDEKKRCLRVW